MDIDWEAFLKQVDSFNQSKWGKAAPAAVSAAAPLVTQGNSTMLGNLGMGIGGAVAMANPVLGAAIMGLSALGNAAFGSNINEGAIKDYQNKIVDYSRPELNAKDNSTLMAQLNGLKDVTINKSDLGTQGWFSHKLDDKYTALKQDLAAADASRARLIDDSISNVNKMNKARIEANYYPFGGPMYGYFDNGAIAYALAMDNMFNKQRKNTSTQPEETTSIFAEGGNIHIKPSKKGTFTAAATKHGKSVQEFASQVLANPENYSSAMVKKANFARNASKWHADGGLLSDNFTNGVTFVNVGGTHGENPNGGVPMGIAEDGQPNLVEEGEVVYNDYVFSNRLKVPKAIRNKYKLRGPENMTFADAFKKAQEESKERENDPISQNGLDNIAMVLARSQEELRAANAHKKAKGGHLFEDGSVLDIWPQLKKYTTDDYLKKQREEILKDYYEPYELEEGETSKETTTSGNNGVLSNFLRAAEPAANAFAVWSDFRGKTNRPTTFDYIPNYTPISFSPVGEYVPNLVLDTNYAANQQAQQAAATRNAILNTTAPNRYANLLAADYNAQIAQGDLLRNAQIANYDNLIKAETFNRATNQFNSEMGLKALADNSQQRLAYANAALKQAEMNESNSNAAWGARAKNLSSLATSLANVGREQDAYNWRDMLMRAGVFGTLSEKPANWTDKEWKAYQNNLTLLQKKAYGGKLKKRRGLTY